MNETSPFCCAFTVDQRTRRENAEIIDFVSSTFYMKNHSCCFLFQLVGISIMMFMIIPRIQGFKKKLVYKPWGQVLIPSTRNNQLLFPTNLFSTILYNNNPKLQLPKRILPQKKPLELTKYEPNKLQKKNKPSNKASSSSSASSIPSSSSSTTTTQPSLELPPLDPLTITEESFLEITKIMRKLDASRKLYQFMEECAKQKTLNWNMTIIAMKNYQFMNRTDLIEPTYKLFQQIDQYQQQIQEKLNFSQQIIHFLCRSGHLSLANTIASICGVYDYTPLQSGSAIDGLDEKIAANDSIDKEFTPVSSTPREELLAMILTDLALGHATNSDYQLSLKMLQRMERYGFTMQSEEVGTKLLSIFLAETNLYFIKNVINVLLRLDTLNNYNSLQLLANYMIRKVEFIKGAVSVPTLPNEEFPEIIFMGRSNVGKSSLINLITNRKKLAYTSKTAGKTSEFNYFLTQGVFGRNATAQSFYLIDLPGVGYAKRSKDLRDKWRNLMSEYIKNRGERSLKCVFHLIDSRHGILDSDYDCFDLLSLLPPSIDYVVVFTKTDKLSYRDSTKYYNGVSREILTKTKEELLRLTDGKREIPILYTSAVNKDGGVSVLSAILNRITSDEKDLRTLPSDL